MASGILGKSALAADTDEVIYTVPASHTAAFNVSILNRDTSNAATVRVALSATATPSDADYIEYETIVGPSDVLERTGVVLSAGWNLIVRASSSTITVNAIGYEEEV